ncbi:unnamed protein product [Clonostachys byssicola]|uniref:Fe2OG dioxygenase domain-containing protein n=1 Tax=Clonostachys byssicola TaxID=160290 RepID=A0A9N9US43_9HYPO|nr:unnamed protein product [Clonostachys byssicola]
MTLSLALSPQVSAVVPTKLSKNDVSPNPAFTPSKHLIYSPPSKVWSLRDLGYPDSQGISPFGVSEPFRLFSDDAIDEMRRELFTNRNIWTDHRFSSKYAECQLRGYARDHAPFIYNAWKSPETLRIISDLAGLDVVPVFDYDIAHINVSGPSVPDLSPLPEDQVGKPAQQTKSEKPRAEDENDAIVSWHNDSYAFVCVTMLSDCTGMVGGETALRTADGNVIKVRGPQRGYAVVLQGRYIDHQALRALGGTERVSMVTAFRARSSEVRDDTNLKLVRPISNIDELYNEYAQYRFGMLEDRFRARRERVDQSVPTKAPFNVKETRAFIREQIKFLEQMEEQIMEEDDWKKLYNGT